MDAIGASGVCEAYYAFPLVVSDNFLASNFGILLNYTCMVEANQLTDGLNWFGQAHGVKVRRNCGFVVMFQREATGEGLPAKRFFSRLTKEKGNRLDGRVVSSDYVRNLIERMERIVKQAGIYGQSEHTVTIIGTDADRKRFEYLQLPVLIKGFQQGQQQAKPEPWRIG